MWGTNGPAPTAPSYSAQPSGYSNPTVPFGNPAMAYPAAPPVMGAPAATAPAYAPTPMGNASPADVAYVQSRLGFGGEQVIGVWRPNEETINKVSFQTLKTLAMMPCFWPHLIIMGPCLYACSKSGQATMRRTMYFATTHGFGTAVEPPNGAGCCDGAPESYDIAPWDSVLGISVQQPGCIGCNQPAAVSIKQHGIHMTGAGDNRTVHQNGQYWYVDDVDEVSRVVRGSMMAARGARVGNP